MVSRAEMTQIATKIDFVEIADVTDISEWMKSHNGEHW